MRKSGFPSPALPSSSLSFFREASIRKVTTLNAVDEVAALYSQTPEREVINGMHNNGKMMPKSERIYQIYTVNSLPALVRVLKEKFEEEVSVVAQKNKNIDPDSEKYENLHSIRYLLTENDEMLFALEGSEPAHFVMTGETKSSFASHCRCAGNLFFNDDFTKFTKVNNKSGDFKPEDILLKRILGVIATLAGQELLLMEDSIQIGHERMRATYTVSFSVLRDYVNYAFPIEDLDRFVTNNKVALHREVNYQPEIKSFRSELEGEANSQESRSCVRRKMSFPPKLEEHSGLALDSDLPMTSSTEKEKKVDRDFTSLFGSSGPVRLNFPAQARSSADSDEDGLGKRLHRETVSTNKKPTSRRKLDIDGSSSSQEKTMADKLRAPQFNI